MIKMSYFAAFAEYNGNKKLWRKEIFQKLQYKMSNKK